MSTLRELKSRIGSVSSIGKTTSAMKMISSAKMRKATWQLQRLSPYRKIVQSVLGHLLATEAEFSSSLIEQREVKRVALVAFGSDDGLCGAFNLNIFKQVLSYINNIRQHEKDIEEVTIIPVGKKLKKAANKLCVDGVNVLNLGYIHTRSSQEDVQRLTQELKDGFLRGDFDRVDVAYMHFKSTSRQTFAIEQLLPVEYSKLLEAADASSATDPCLFEPDATTILNSVLPLHVRSVVQEVFTESIASEQAARVMAMQTASDNAKELLDALNLEYNKLRQQGITTELLDILGGQVER